MLRERRETQELTVYNSVYVMWEAGKMKEEWRDILRCSTLNQVEVSEVGTFMGREKAVPGRRQEGICRNLGRSVSSPGWWLHKCVCHNSFSRTFMFHVLFFMSYFAIRLQKIFFFYLLLTLLRITLLQWGRLTWFFNWKTSVVCQGRRWRQTFPFTHFCRATSDGDGLPCGQGHWTAI